MRHKIAKGYLLDQGVQEKQKKKYLDNLVKKVYVDDIKRNINTNLIDE